MMSPISPNNIDIWKRVWKQFTENISNSRDRREAANHLLDMVRSLTSKPKNACGSKTIAFLKETVMRSITKKFLLSLQDYELQASFVMIAFKFIKYFNQCGQKSYFEDDLGPSLKQKSKLELDMNVCFDQIFSS
jgi:hypothetical protein